jgi:hypothetical protein
MRPSPAGPAGPPKPKTAFVSWPLAGIVVLGNSPPTALSNEHAIVPDIRSVAAGKASTLTARLRSLVPVGHCRRQKLGHCPWPATTQRGLCTSNRANGACQTQPLARLLTFQPDGADTRHDHVNGNHCLTTYLNARLVQVQIGAAEGAVPTTTHALQQVPSAYKQRRAMKAHNRQRCISRLPSISSCLQHQSDTVKGLLQSSEAI